MNSACNIPEPNTVVLQTVKLRAMCWVKLLITRMGCASSNAWRT